MESGSERLASSIAAIRKLAERKEVGKRVRPELLEMADALEPHRERLAEIEDLYAIDFGDDVDHQIAEAAKLWSEAKPGPLRGQELLKVRRASPLLSELFRKGIDIKSAHKFGPVESQLANWFGTHINETSDLLHALRRERKSEREEDTWQIIVPLSRVLEEAFTLLHEKGVLKFKKTLIQNREGRFTPFRWEWLRDDPDARLLVVYEKRNVALAHMLTGHWLNSYVYGIIDNQLSRHEVPYELYTEVAYKAPPDLIRTASDFDVIGRFRDTVICVECKSGRLDDKHGQIRDITQRTEDLRTVLSTMGAGETEFLFFVVYDPEMNDAEEMAAKLKPFDIHPIRPNEVRSVIARTLDAALR